MRTSLLRFLVIACLMLLVAAPVSGCVHVKGEHSVGMERTG